MGFNSEDMTLLYIIPWSYHLGLLYSVCLEKVCDDTPTNSSRELLCVTKNRIIISEWQKELLPISSYQALTSYIFASIENY